MKTKKIPMRRCIGCRASKPKKELIRIVRTPEGEIALDSTGKMNGRGAYICPDGMCLEEAMKLGRLSGALETDIGGETLEKLRSDLNKIG